VTDETGGTPGIVALGTSDTGLLVVTAGAVALQMRNVRETERA
jgi:hypothetical protein